jgi:short-subunit dehydrogenase
LDAFKFENKLSTTLILGASSDVALACARQLASAKSNLILAGRDIESLSIISNDLRIRYQVEVKAFQFDALAFESHEQFYRDIETKPDVTICVFGLLGDQAESEKSWNASQRVIESNYTGAVSILNVIANDYEKRKTGVIVGISSVAGERGRQSNYIYGSAKAGFTAYLSGLRNRMFKSGVHVVTVKPGFIDTRMTAGLKLPKPITAKPDQVAKAILRSIKKKKNIVYTLPIWQLIMMIIKNIPEGIFKKLKL